jgi:hypothetical protein
MTRIPTIHLNGSCGETLLSDHLEVLRFVSGLFRALSAVTPNARDYYMQGVDAHRHAMNDHRARLAALDLIKIQIGEIVDGIQDQLDARKESKR